VESKAVVADEPWGEAAGLRVDFAVCAPVRGGIATTTTPSAANRPKYGLVFEQIPKIERVVLCME